MKRCPRCSRPYDDDTLSYCLDDGTRLITGHDAEATQVNPFPAQPPAPTVAYAAPTMPSPAAPPPPPPPAPTTAAVEPASRRKAMLAVSAIVLAVVAIALSVAGLMFQRYNSPSAAAVASASPTPSPVVAAATPRAASPTPAAGRPTPAAATPTPAPMATPSRSVVQSTPEPKPGCVLYNDTADRTGVRVRADCDTRDCDSDSSTIVGEYPDNTPVSVIKGANVRGQRFTWVKVIITDSGQRVWVASTKIKCN